MKKILLVFLLVLSLVVVAACNRDESTEGGVDTTPANTTPAATEASGGEDTTDTTDSTDPTDPPSVFEEIHPALLVLDQRLTTFPRTMENSDPILQPGDPGNTIRIVTGSDTTFPGLFDTVLQSEAYDSAIMGYQLSPFVWTDELFMWVDGGIANLTFLPDENAIELNMNETVFWHDGVELTLDDLVFAYEYMALNNYHGGVGICYSATHFITWVVGIEEFRSGQADHIEGMVLSNNNRTLRIYYDQPLPPSAQYSGGIWLTPSPRHYLEPVALEIGWENMHEHPRARHEALGFGPWIIESIVPGESVLFRANENYHRGRPNIDFLHWVIRPDATWQAEMREGQGDVAGLSASQFEEHLLHNPNNYTLLGAPGTGTGFMYFRTGIFDYDNNEVVPREDGWHPIQNVAIRRALSHAMPQQLIADTINNGLGVPAGTILHPHNARPFISAEIPGFHFDLDHARNILDEAGFTEFGSDGFRLDLDGNPMFFNFAANQNSFNDRAVPVYLDHWREIGLDVRLYQGDTIEWNQFLENLLTSDNWSDEVHMFISNWSLGNNPNPNSLWGHDAPFNMSRHTSEEMRGIMADIVSQNAFDNDFLADAYFRWQMYAYENAIANQMFWSIGLTIVNNRVSGYTTLREPGLIGTSSSHLWGLTAPQPYSNTN